MFRVLVEIHEGHIVRNLLENDLLGLLTARNAEVMVVTPAARVPSFVERYRRHRVSFADLASEGSVSRMETYEMAVGDRLCRRRLPLLRRALWRWLGEPLAARRAKRERALIGEWRPDVVVSTHISQVYGRALVAAARQNGIPTVGNLNSWDNVWKGLWVRPDVVTCWSENNRDELCQIAGYRPEDLEVIGAPAFDAYFAPDAKWSREDLCGRLGLDPARPFILFATLGQFRQQIDETSPLEAFLHAIDRGEISGRPQVVLRLHPWSREIYFKALTSRADLAVSRYENYVPGLTWTPTREEAILAGNLLRHAEVVVSPGSTMCIEAAMFDTPGVVPAFNEYMPEVFDRYFARTWLHQHFGRIYRNNWVPLARNAAEMVASINHALSDRNWCWEGRQKIREEILGPLDGRATERFADVILRVVRRGVVNR